MPYFEKYVVKSEEKRIASFCYEDNAEAFLKTIVGAIEAKKGMGGSFIEVKIDVFTKIYINVNDKITINEKGDNYSIHFSGFTSPKIESDRLNHILIS